MLDYYNSATILVHVMNVFQFWLFDEWLEGDWEYYWNFLLKYSILWWISNYKQIVQKFFSPYFVIVWYLLPVYIISILSQKYGANEISIFIIFITIRS